MPAPKARQWYRIENQASDPTVAEIHIIDIIGDWIDELINEFWGMKATLTAKAFIDQLAKLDAVVTTIRVHINSPGGDVFAAANIANALRDQQLSKNRTVETIVDGLAASAASVIAMAGSKVSMADNALLMIHQPWSGAVGNAAQMRKVADTLDIITKSIVAAYQWHSTKTAEDITAMMDAETWLTADDALAAGFVTDKIEGLKAAASIDPKAVATMKVPEKYRDRVQAFIAPVAAEPVKASATAVLAQCTAAGLDLAFANELLTDGPTLEQATARIQSAQSQKAAASARATAISALCATAKLPQLADGYIKGAMSESDVRAHLTTITAVVDKVEIETGLNPSGAAGAKTAISTIAVYNDRNRRVKE